MPFSSLGSPDLLGPCKAEALKFLSLYWERKKRKMKKSSSGKVLMTHKTNNNTNNEGKCIPVCSHQFLLRACETWYRRQIKKENGNSRTQQSSCEKNVQRMQRHYALFILFGYSCGTQNKSAIFAAYTHTDTHSGPLLKLEMSTSLETNYNSVFERNQTTRNTLYARYRPLQFPKCFHSHHSLHPHKNLQRFIL